MRQFQHSVEVFQKARDGHGKEQYAVTDLISAAYYWTDATAEEVVGTNNANGTTVLSLSVPATTTFICTIVTASCNLAAFLKIGYGTIAGPPTDVCNFDVTPRGTCGYMTEKLPVFVYDNTTDAAVTLLIFAPHTAWNVADNDAITKYFNAFIGGLLVPD